ncbi:LytR/AlgR family response regulator transcription factor [Alkaliphilus peptidifermentans]|uniref:Stage 0 sporulation protein A homolog n=1 Tax=Alkaliphilus peptidifermentans DSM 18978 TaxID=1120976 RepID=A0A1G5GGF7_9FIRM|nr:LytTR family DNA-binding domain-containing protein [Alkaliphilus peptidifermentans]SCY50656.1 two component transcriptional regulator, LytTR family [Alkaliphilus peptidifermentans DSM 18978]
MKITIAICDDHPIQVDLLKNFIEAMKLPIEIDYLLTYSGEELLLNIDKKILDIVFLDVEMKNINGIETGRIIRQKFPQAIIVFITGYKHYALEAFELYSFQYILKPITMEKMQDIMNKIILRIQELNVLNDISKLFVFKNKEEVVQLRVDDIYFFEKEFRKIKIQTKNGKYSYYGTIKLLLEELDSSLFIQCQQGYIVNRTKILEVRDYCIYFRDVNEKVPISRRFKKQVIEAFEKNLFRLE